VGCDPFTFLSHTVHNPGLPSAFDHLKKWFRGVSGKKKGLVRIHGCVHYQSRCQKDSIWHLLGSKPLLSHITRTRPRLVNIALSGPMSFFSPFHTTPQMLRRRNLETSRKCYLETPQRPFQVPFARMCSVPKNVRNYWDPGFVSSGCLHFEHCWHLLGPKPLLKPM